VDGLFPGLLGRAAFRNGADEALEPLADEGVADVGVVLEELHLVEVDRDGAGDPAEDVARGERLREGLLVIGRGRVVGHGGAREYRHERARAESR
jgi:hypothetical protein